MKRATVTLTQDLEEAMESYRRELEFPPSLAALMQAALREYLHRRGHVSLEGQSSSDIPAIYEDAPNIGEGKTASQMVLEDRR